MRDALLSLRGRRLLLLILLACAVVLAVAALQGGWHRPSLLGHTRLVSLGRGLQQDDHIHASTRTTRSAAGAIGAADPLGGTVRAHSKHHLSSHGARGGVRHAAQHAWASYNTALQRQPLMTKIYTGVVGTILGDILAQYSSYMLAGQPSARERRKFGGKAPPPFRYDVLRLLRLLAWSAVIGTPLAHFWFAFLDRNVFPRAPTSAAAVLTKLALDQGFMAPFGTVLFFSLMKVMEGQPQLAPLEVRAKLRPTLLANWVMWIPANLINFALIPLEQRILYVNVLAVAWSAFMSHIANKPIRADAGTPAVVVPSSRDVDLRDGKTSPLSNAAKLQMRHWDGVAHSQGVREK